MTRVNVVPVSELSDQHLFAEFRELKMVPKSLARSINAHGFTVMLNRIPSTYRMGVGHVSFFYDKSLYLYARYDDICAELSRRGVAFNTRAVLDEDRVFDTDARLWNNYVPTPEALALNRARIAERIAARPAWYRFTAAGAAR